MCAEALADIVVFNQTFLQAKKCKKKKNLNYAVCVSRLWTGACVFTEPNKKHSKINGLWQPTNGMNYCFILKLNWKQILKNFRPTWSEVKNAK